MKPQFDEMVRNGNGLVNKKDLPDTTPCNDNRRFWRKVERYPLCISETLARSAIYTDFLFLLCKNETKVKTKHFYIVGCEFWRLGSWKDIYFLTFDFFIKQSWLGCEERQGSKVITQCAPLVLTNSITPWFVHNLIKSVNISVLCGALLDLLHSRM